MNGFSFGDKSCCIIRSGQRTKLSWSWCLAGIICAWFPLFFGRQFFGFFGTFANFRHLCLPQGFRKKLSEGFKILVAEKKVPLGVGWLFKILCSRIQIFNRRNLCLFHLGCFLEVCYLNLGLGCKLLILWILAVPFCLRSCAGFGFEDLWLTSIWKFAQLGEL